MRSLHLHPYRTPEEVRQVVDRLHVEVSPIVHPQQIIQKMRSERRCRQYGQSRYHGCSGRVHITTRPRRV